MADLPAPTPPESYVNPDLGELVQKSRVYTNVSQDFIVTAEDKIRLCLIEYQEALTAEDAWIAPAGLLVPVTLTLVSADFHSFAGVPPAEWFALFLLTAVGCGIWLVQAIFRIWSTRKKRGIGRVIQAMKAQSQ